MKIFRENPYFLIIGPKYGALYEKNLVMLIFRDDCFRKKDPLLKGRGINFVMLGEVVQIYLVYAGLSLHKQIVYLVLILSDLE